MGTSQAKVSEEFQQAQAAAQGQKPCKSVKGMNVHSVAAGKLPCPVEHALGCAGAVEEAVICRGLPDLGVGPPVQILQVPP